MLHDDAGGADIGGLVAITRTKYAESEWLQLIGHERVVHITRRIEQVLEKLDKISVCRSKHSVLAAKGVCLVVNLPEVITELLALENELSLAEAVHGVAVVVAVVSVVIGELGGR